MGDGKSFHHDAIALRHQLEFVKQARFADSGFGHGGNDLAAPTARKCKRVPELL
jgi:hypothetical protein